MKFLVLIHMFFLSANAQLEKKESDDKSIVGTWIQWMMWSTKLFLQKH